MAAPDAGAARLDSGAAQSGPEAAAADLAAGADGPVSTDERSQPGEDATGQAVGQSADRPGPLALAASAAREAAEARIRAARHQTRRSGLEAPYQLENPYPSATFDVTDLTPPQSSAAGSAGAADAWAADAWAPNAWAAAPVEGSATRPEAASGAQAWAAHLRPEAGSPHQRSDIASSWGGPVFDAPDDGESPAEPFTPAPDLAAYLDEGPEPDPDPADDPRQGHSSGGYARRNRITRGYSIPRLSRSKRPGAVPGA